MQGGKDFTPKLFYELSLDCLVPQEDFYRKVNQHLELHFLYKATAPYYGREGQQSIDPVVFFKINHLRKTPRIIALKMTIEKGLVCILQNQQYSHQNRGYKLS